MIEFILGAICGAVISYYLSNFLARKKIYLNKKYDIVSCEIEKADISFLNLKTGRNNKELLDILYEISDKSIWMREATKTKIMHKFRTGEKEKFENWYKEYGEFIIQLEENENSVYFQNQHIEYVNFINELKNLKSTIVVIVLSLLFILW